ncbi:predicted protein [Coccidioides posadasii str. Silveira]|uniref:Predicted protein n=2 Tax=Coccidioides posadasii TaxID=199306 RepID=E9CTZ4_COCPS|nr:predicted protein [Coccidioides posadasii str. Silveira]KMM67180.1 hypothetical protein CPAG_03515 [Coccidioides posadasii RMSCC 3488]
MYDRELAGICAGCRATAGSLALSGCHGDEKIHREVLLHMGCDERNHWDLIALSWDGQASSNVFQDYFAPGRGKTFFSRDVKFNPVSNGQGKKTVLGKAPPRLATIAPVHTGRPNTNGYWNRGAQGTFRHPGSLVLELVGVALFVLVSGRLQLPASETARLVPTRQ